MDWETVETALLLNCSAELMCSVSIKQDTTRSKILAFSCRISG